MKIEEVYEKFILDLLEAVEVCDQELRKAYEKRQQTIKELHEWLVEAWKEASLE